MQQTEKYWDIIHRVVVTVVLIMAVGGIVLTFSPKIKQMNTYQHIRRELQIKIDANVAKEKELIEKRHRYKTDRTFVERIAHERGYARKDEVIFLLPEEPLNTNETTR